MNALLQALNIKQINSEFFDTLHIQVDAQKLKDLSEKAQINFHYPDEQHATIALNETCDDAFMDRLQQVFENYANTTVTSIPIPEHSNLPKALERQTPYMEHSVFHRYQTETALMRSIKQLERKDLALNHSMIALGSCTMKLNAAAEMLPLSHAQWNQIHPFVPQEQAAGYQILIQRLEEQLNDILRPVYEIIVDAQPEIVDDIKKIVENPMNLPDSPIEDEEEDDDPLF